MFNAAKIKDGEDLIKLSLILSLTPNPASIKIDKPTEDNNSNAGE